LAAAWPNCSFRTPSELAQRAGKTLELRQVVVRDCDKPRDVKIPAGILSSDLKRITSDPAISVVAHLVGGLEPARTIMLALLESGKDVVTANKALLAEHGPELFDRARSLGRSIAFDAAVGGGIPIITNVSQCLSANRIESLTGILNGTSNFILTQMEEQGEAYEAAVAEAQRLGFAEADPTMDVDGSDATQKIAILAHLGFGSRIDWRTVPRVGIDTLATADLQYAKELGYRIKLVANAHLSDNKLQIHVSPTLCKIGTPLAEVRGAHNAIVVEGNAVGRLLFHGLGAGQMPTASAVLADMIDMVNGRAKITFNTLELWKQQPAQFSPVEFKNATGKVLPPVECRGSTRGHGRNHLGPWQEWRLDRVNHPARIRRPRRRGAVGDHDAHDDRGSDRRGVRSNRQTAKHAKPRGQDARLGLT
jgi:homoserine dehydrogenase